MSTAAADQPLIGQKVLIFGGTGGIGQQTARVLARSGARVIITGREPDTGEQVAAAIRRESGPDSVTFLRADHSSVGGNQDLADRVRAAVPRLNALINNVGGLYQTRTETADGYEATLAMNFIGPYALTAELLPLLRAGVPSRCVNVVSAGFKMWKIDPFADVQSADRFVSGDAYAPHQAAQRACQSGLGPPSHRRPDFGEPRPPRHVVDTDDPVNDRADDAVLPAGLATAAATAAPRVAATAGRRVAFVASLPQAAGYTGRYFEGRRTPSRLSARELDPDNQDRAWRLGAELVAAAPTNRHREAQPGAG